MTDDVRMLFMGTISDVRYVLVDLAVCFCRRPWGDDTFVD